MAALILAAGYPKDGVQSVVKDSRKYATTDGWKFAHFSDGQPTDEAVLKTCFPCHQAIKIATWSSPVIQLDTGITAMTGQRPQTKKSKTT